MGLFGLLKSYGMARITGGLMRRALGGNFLAAAAAFWVGRRLYRSRTRRVAPGSYR